MAAKPISDGLTVKPGSVEGKIGSKYGRIRPIHFGCGTQGWLASLRRLVHMILLHWLRTLMVRSYMNRGRDLFAVDRASGRGRAQGRPAL
jgi:hypothetical protein